MPLVASLVDVSPNNDPNKSNNVDPRRRDVPPPVLRLLIGTHRLSVSLPLSLPLNHSRDGEIAAVDEEASELGMLGFRLLCTDNSSYTRYSGEDSQMKS